MNCEKFERVVTDIARGQLTQAGLREEAILHTQACKVCAARFAQAQNLSVALRALALLDENKKALVIFRQCFFTLSCRIYLIIILDVNTCAFPMIFMVYIPEA